MAADRGALDLSECDLEEVPPEAFNIPGLRDLSLAGNNLAELPPEISRLTSLERLQLAGNCFRTLPDSIGDLPNLQGLWVGGNVLESLPDTIGGLGALRTLALSGNRLASLPASLGELTSLRDLELPGNVLEALPDSLEGLSSLVKFSAYGNRLAALPGSIGALTALRELWFQGNNLTALPPSIGQLQALVELSVADNRIETLPAEVAGLTSLRSLSIYGNRLHVLPETVLRLPALRALWLEANPLENSGELKPAAADHYLALGPNVKNVGLDQFQVGRLPRGTLYDLAEVLKPGQIAPGDYAGPGYFKLKRAERRDVGSLVPQGQPRLLVVAFGSAPGVPNWGALLQRASDGMANDDERFFDTLFVVDPSRDWWGGGDDEAFGYYRRRVAEFSERYEKVLLLGDSMGGTAALLFSGLATAAHAFTPQVDLENSSIRPGRGLAWCRALKERILSEAAASDAAITVHVGNWLHDLRQARQVPKEHALLEIYQMDSHRLAFYLDQDNKLVPLIQRALKKELGCAEIKKVRMTNLL